MSGDGHLDPNEVWVDSNHNGQVDNGEDQSQIVSIDPNGNIGISENSLGELTVSFYATTRYADGTTHYGLQTVQIVAPGSQDAPSQPYQDQTVSVPQGNGQQKQVTLPDPARANPHILPRNDFLGFATVVSVGDIIPGAGTVQQISTYDPINDDGQVVFWVKTDQGQAIVLANPPISVRGQVAYALQNLPLSQNADLADLASGGLGKPGTSQSSRHDPRSSRPSSPATRTQALRLPGHHRLGRRQPELGRHHHRDAADRPRASTA